MPPPQQNCTAPGCDFETPLNIPTWELVIQCLTNHTQVAHAVQPIQQPRDQGVLSARPKPAPVQRPEIDLGTTESEWNFFIAEFDRYKRTTGITGQTVLDELWHCHRPSSLPTMADHLCLPSISLPNIAIGYERGVEQKLIDSRITFFSRQSDIAYSLWL